jgi:parallel beta-helix repeat protein
MHNVGYGGSYYGIYLYRCRDAEVIGNEIHDAYYGIYTYYVYGGYIANNMIIADGYGERDYYVYDSSLEHYYNSYYSTGTYGVYHYASSSYPPGTFRNNIIYGAGTYAFYNSSSSVPPNSDYNNFYAPSGSVGYYGGAQATLADWQAASGQDLNSVSGDPQYTSTTDLHILTTVPSPVNNAGTPIAGITTDIDGDLRDVALPDIGADEFEGFIYDYDVTLSPENIGSIAEPSDVVDYMFFVTNRGALNDTYDLAVTVTGEAWTHEVRDATGASIISSISVNAGTVDSFLVRVTVDAGAARETSSNGEVTAVSQNMPLDNTYSDTSWTVTYIPPFSVIPFNWVEINPARPGALPGTNTGIINDDQLAGPFAMGFNFPFYDCLLYNQLKICSNGWMTFNTAETGTHLTNEEIPNSTTPDLVIAPYWDDMRPAVFGSSPDYHGEIYYYHDAANGRFIVEYDSVSHYGTSYLPNEFTFEAIFYASGDIELMYKVVNPGTLSPFPSATVGYENATGTVGIQCTYNGSGPVEPASNMGIRINTRCDLPPAAPVVVISMIETDPEMVSAVLSWDPVPDAAQYKIYKSYTGPTGLTLVDSTTNTQWTDAGVIAGSPKCFYYVTADDVAVDHYSAIPGAIFPPESMRHLFRPTHVENSNAHKK